MTRKFQVLDYGKDFGPGRYCMNIDDCVPSNRVKRIGTNDTADIYEAVDAWVKNEEREAEP